MRYAETGFNLEIDLSTGRIEKVESPTNYIENFIGGLGTSAKIIWDRILPEIKPFSEENLLIFSAGLLCGTLAPGANRTIISSISPQTNLMAFSMLGGFWAPELKFAGYDKVIIKGKSSKLVYIWINNDKVEIRNATHLKGKSTYETIEILKKELNNKEIQVLSIGLAGENKVYFSSIETVRGSASRLGLGAIMGDKNLKAIAVRGTNDIYIANPSKLFKLTKDIQNYIKYRMENPIPGRAEIHNKVGAPQEMREYDEEWHLNNFAWGNARYRRKNYWNKEIENKWKKTLEKVRGEFIGCFNCSVACAATVSISPYSPITMKCFSKLSYGMAAMVDDPEFYFKIAAKAQHYGVDSFTTPQVMAFAVELYENGILTDKDLPNFPKDNAQRFYYLLDKIVRREGIGDILADGVYWAARKIGKGAEKFDHNTIKKHEQVPVKLGTLNPIYFLLHATGEKLTITQVEGSIPQDPIPKEAKEKFLKEWIQVPKWLKEEATKFVKDFGEPYAKFPYWPPIDIVCKLVDWQELMHYIDDSTGICAGLSSFQIQSPYHINNLPDVITAATGIEFTDKSLWETAQRIRTLVRAINVRRGLRREDEKPPEDHWKRRFPDYEKKLLDEYYKFKGWDENGIPTKETLKKLKLDFVKL